MKDFAEAFYKSTRWLKCRDLYFTKMNGICERCGEAGKIVHHKIHLTPANIRNPQIALSQENLEVLCQKCHNKEHGENMKRGRIKPHKARKQNNSRYAIDDSGNILPPGSA